MKPLLSAAALAALIMLPSTADAAAPFCKKQNGIDWCSRHVWDNQLAPGEPVATFPPGCLDDDCDYTVRILFREGVGISPDGSDDCSNDPDTVWWECEPNDHCVLYVEFGPGPIPLIDWHGVNPENGDTATAAMINTAFLNRRQKKRSLTPTWEGHNGFTGSNYQWLGVILGDVEVTNRGLCRVNFSAGYHPNNKAFGSRGLLLPPVQ